MKKQLSRFYYLVLSVALLFAVSSCSDEDDNVSVQSISLKENKISIVENDSKKLVANILPSDATNQEINWATSDSKIVTVKDGLVTAVEPGNAKITVTTVDGEKKAVCEVVVTEKVYHVESISLNKSELEIIETETFQLVQNILPENATNKNVVWTSSDENIATVIDGLVTAIKPGENVTISVKSEDGAKKAECNLTVLRKAISVTGISMNETRLDLVEGETFQFSVRIHPAEADNKNFTLVSDNPKVASIDDDYLMTCMSEGKAIITATSEDGNKTASCEIYVTGRDEFTDERDGHVYKIIKIGDQVWMAENLAYLPTVNKEKEVSETDARYYVYKYDGNDTEEAKKSEKYETYGVLYNFPALSANIAPKGWHVPTDEEWKTMEKALGFSDYSLNSTGYRGQSYTFKSTTGWFRGRNGSNESGLNIYPGGKNCSSGYFYNSPQWAYLWTSTCTSDNKCAYRYIFNSEDGVGRDFVDSKANAYSVRCVKDKE